MREHVRFAFSLLRALPPVTMLAWFAMSTHGLGQTTPEELVKDSLVHLIVKAIPDVPTQPGQEPKLEEMARGTGFVVSRDGFVLTNYHLVKDLSGYKPGSLVISASFGQDEEINRRKLQLVKSDAAFDLLLLKGAEGSATYKPVVFSDSNGIKVLNADSELYSAGFPRAEDPTLQTEPVSSRGSVKDRNGPDAHLWNLSLEMNAGQSGSPVFTKNGHVVGIATSDSRINKSTNFMIPAYFADSLLAHVKFAAMEEKYAALEERINKMEKDKIDPSIGRIGEAETSLKEIQSNFMWSAANKQQDLNIVFRKLASSGPVIEKLRLSITPSVSNKEGLPVDIGSVNTDFDFDGDPDYFLLTAYDKNTRKGTFSVKAALDVLRRKFCSEGKSFVLDKFTVGIEPFLKDDVALEPEYVTVDYPLVKKGCANAVPNG